MVKKAKPEIEFEQDAWERFERAVKTVAKSPPQHRMSKTKPKVGKTLAKPAPLAKR